MRPNSEQRPRILTAGYLTLDLIVRDENSRDFWQAVGGTCGNVSVFASALGCEVVMLARLGQDRRGQRLLQELASTAVDISRVERAPKLASPGIVELVRNTPGRTHRFTHRCPVCGTRLPRATVVTKQQAEAEVESIDRFDAFFFDRATSATVHLAESARRAGLLVVYEPSSIPRGIWAKRATEVSDIVKLSAQPNPRVERWLPSGGASTSFIVHTLGPQGARILGRSSERWEVFYELPASAQPCIRDTAGAGDWLTAGLLSSMLQTPHSLSADSIRKSVEYGQRLSAVSLAFDGPGGALAALGARDVERMARGVLPMHVPFDGESYTSPKIGRDSPPVHYCELCLTDLPVSSLGRHGHSRNIK